MFIPVVNIPEMTANNTNNIIIIILLVIKSIADILSR